MKAELTTFPYGAADGLPVLRLDFDGAPWSSAEAEAAGKRLGGARGIWGVWPVGLESWEHPDLVGWAEGQCVIALRELGAPDWPAADLATVLDVSGAMEHATDIDELAGYVAARAGALPVVEDVVAVITKDHRAPLASALDLLTDFAQPQGQGYLYAPRGHVHWPLFVRAISQCGSMWSLRSS